MKRRDLGLAIGAVALMAASMTAGGLLFGGGDSGVNALDVAGQDNTIVTPTAAAGTPTGPGGTGVESGGLVPAQPGPSTESEGQVQEGSDPDLPSEGQDGDIEPVNEAPFVTDSVPGDGARGVSPDTMIEVSFSETMDPASAEAAFSIMPNVSGTFSWDDGHQVMTFTPDVPFDYNTKVAWSVANTAADNEGLGMAADHTGSFHVLRQKTISLYSQPARDGYVYAPTVQALQAVVTAGDDGHNSLRVGTWMRGFLSFDLAKLPADTVDITNATLLIHQRDHHEDAYGAETGALWLIPLPYGNLDAGDYAVATPTICTNVCFPLGELLSASAADGWKSVDVSQMVRADWKKPTGDITAEAIPGKNERLSQFRLQFMNENQGDGPNVWAEFHSGEAGGHGPRLEVTFVYP